MSAILIRKVIGLVQAVTAFIVEIILNVFEIKTPYILRNIEKYKTLTLIF